MNIPWICYGQTLVPVNQAVDNPQANLAGCRGEVELPYVVPDGYELVISAYGIESYAQEGGSADKGLVIVPWLGEETATNEKCLHSVYAQSSSNETIGVKFHIPAGKKVNARIMNAEVYAQTVGWYISGELIPTFV